MEPIEILEKVNAFYDSAWNKLIWFTSGLLAVVGIVVPIFISWMQNRTLRIRKEEIRDEIRMQLSEDVQVAIENFNNSITDAINNLRSEMDHEIYYLRGFSFLAQAREYSKEGHPDISVGDALISANYFLRAKEHTNLPPCHHVILEGLKAMNREQYQGYSFHVSVDQYLERLDFAKIGMYYVDFIEEVKQRVEELS